MREVACKLRPAGKNGDSGSAAGKKVKNAKKILKRGIETEKGWKM